MRFFFFTLRDHYGSESLKGLYIGKMFKAKSVFFFTV